MRKKRREAFLSLPAWVQHSYHEGFWHGSMGRARHRNPAEAKGLISWRFSSTHEALGIKASTDWQMFAEEKDTVAQQSG